MWLREEVSGEEGVGRREWGGGDKSTSLLPSSQARDNFLGRQYLHFDLLTPGKFKKVVGCFNTMC